MDELNKVQDTKELKGRRLWAHAADIFKRMRTAVPGVGTGGQIQLSCLHFSDISGRGSLACVGGGLKLSAEGAL